MTYILGIRTPLSTTSIPAPARTASNAAVNVESRSRIGLAGGDDPAREEALGAEQAGALVLDGALRGEPVDLDRAVLVPMR